jgi:hypothetical protein
MHEKRNEMIFLATLKNKGNEYFLSIYCHCIVASAEDWGGNLR